VEQRTPGRARDDGRIGKAVVKKATLVVLARLGRKGALSGWTAATSERRPRGWENFSLNKAAKGMCRHTRHSDSLA
jgi:hypothetical protein